VDCALEEVLHGMDEQEATDSRQRVPLMKKISDILLIVGGGMLLLISVVHFERWHDLKSPGLRVLLGSFAAVSLLLLGLLARVDHEQKVRAFAARIVESYKAMAILTLNALVAWACLELAAMGIVKSYNLFREPAASVQDPREKSSYYTSQSWAAEYWREFAASRQQNYHPYVVWRRSPFKGNTINIDQNGIRSTPGADCAANSFKVFTFGGSTMWGTGAPDWGTIPAYLQASLEKLKGGHVCVVNFAESGYVSTQSVIELLTELQAGNIPNWVFFYDGPNDVYTGYQSGRTEVHENLDLLAARFENRRPPESDSVKLLESFYLFRMADSLVSKLGRPPPAAQLATYETKGIDAAALTQSIVQKYLGNYRIVDGLAREYGFKYFFFWPPYIAVSKKPLKSEEKNLKVAVDPALDRLYRLAYRAIEQAVPEYQNLYYLGEVFDDYEPVVWLDDVHVTPDGNRLISEKILEIATQAEDKDELAKKTAEKWTAKSARRGEARSTIALGENLSHLDK